MSSYPRHEDATANDGQVSRGVLTLVALAAVSTSASAEPAASRTTNKMQRVSRVRDPAARSANVIYLAPTPASVIAKCRRVQAVARFRMLCPRVLPRAVLGLPGQPPPPLASGLVRTNSRRPPVGVDIGYGAPWEPDSGTGWRQHLWRNRPCCFLHLVIQHGRPVRGARPAVLGGRRGRLLPASSSSYAGPYFGNHVRFFFRERGVDYVATLHNFGNAATTALLGRLIAELRPVSALRAPTVRLPTTAKAGITGPRAIAAVPGALWILAREQPINPAAPWLGARAALIRADPRTGESQARTAILGTARGLAATTDAAWVAVARQASAEVLRVSPATARVVATVRTGTWPSALAANAHGVWVTNAAPFFKRGTLVHIDPATNRLEGPPIPLGPAPSGLAVGAGSVWVADAIEGTIRRIDVARRRTVAKIGVGGEPYAVVFARGSIWVTNSDDSTVTRIDPSNEAVVKIRVGRNPHGIAAGSRSLWVASLGSGTVSRIAPSGRVLRKLTLCPDPVAVAATSRAAWVTCNNGARAIRVG
jgi:streptogramin lyase